MSSVVAETVAEKKRPRDKNKNFVNQETANKVRISVELLNKPEATAVKDYIGADISDMFHKSFFHLHQYIEGNLKHMEERVENPEKALRLKKYFDDKLNDSRDRVFKVTDSIEPLVAAFNGSAANNTKKLMSEYYLFCTEFLEKENKGTNPFMEYADNALNVLNSEHQRIFHRIKGEISKPPMTLITSALLVVNSKAVKDIMAELQEHAKENPNDVAFLKGYKDIKEMLNKRSRDRPDFKIDRLVKMSGELLKDAETAYKNIGRDESSINRVNERICRINSTSGHINTRRL